MALIPFEPRNIRDEFTNEKNMTEDMREIREPALKYPVRVLFLWNGNSARSQIAEALLQRKAGERFIVAKMLVLRIDRFERIVLQQRLRGIADESRSDSASALSQGKSSAMPPEAR